MHRCQVSARLLLTLTCVGIVAIFSTACSSDSPSSPSALTEVGLPLETSSDVSSADLGSASGLTNGRLDDGRETQSSARRGDENRRVQYCKNLPKNHEHYDRCQTWLNSPRNKENAAKRNAADGKKRRVAYCKSLPKDHEDYDRCQTWLNSPRDKENAAKRNAADGKKRRVAYCKGLPKGHENYDRCQTWLNSGNQRRGPRTK